MAYTTDEAVSVRVLACRDCAGMRALDLASLFPSAEEPCECGCGWFRIMCQMCGRVIGEATTVEPVNLCALLT
jgi:hypothetical protein